MDPGHGSLAWTADSLRDLPPVTTEHRCLPFLQGKGAAEKSEF